MPAHPRVCGENPRWLCAPTKRRGSSPRVRGKLSDASEDRPISRLIPACAGKTRTSSARSRVVSAHPRVCGENFVKAVWIFWVKGSSPRVRGKRKHSDRISAARGLIPACAGKTSCLCRFRRPAAAHPRVCGENKISFGVQALKLGSSPRVRGKLTLHSVKRRDDGLIPACAGKTVSNFDSACRVWAHPRVCGENSKLHRRMPVPLGSSPRVRGKRSLSHADTGIPGLIPACAGKT